MGSVARLRREKAQRRPIALTFFDVDYRRGPFAHGHGIPSAGPEGCAIGRAGLVHAVWDGDGLRITDNELIDGHRPASHLISALHGKQLVIGHGILVSDLRAVAMVTEVPDSLLERTIDTLAFAHRIRGGKYPLGCGLSALADANLSESRTKPSISSSAIGLRPGMRHASPNRGDADPRDDAMLVARLWQTMMSTRLLAWGAGRPSWSDPFGNTRPGAPVGAAALADENIAELTGQKRQIEAIEWAQRLRSEGRVLLPTNKDLSAAMLARHSCKDLPAPQQVRAIADDLQAVGEIPADRHLNNEDFFTACQFLGPRQNGDVRQRILSGKRLTKPLRQNVGFALWEFTHPEWVAMFWESVYVSNISISNWLKMMDLRRERAETRQRIADHLTTQ